MSGGLANSIAPYEFDGGVPPVPVMRFTVEQYQELVRSGILLDDAPVELLDGWIVPKMNKSAEHSYATRRVRIVLEQLVGAEYWVTSQDAIKLPESMPEPDSAVIRGRDIDFEHRLALPADIVLVVEVADSSLRRDRGLKKNVYARARIPEYWVVNLITRTLEVHTNPAGEGRAADFGARHELTESDSIPLVLDGRELGRVVAGSLMPSKR